MGDEPQFDEMIENGTLDPENFVGTEYSKEEQNSGNPITFKSILSECSRKISIDSFPDEIIGLNFFIKEKLNLCLTDQNKSLENL